MISEKGHIRMPKAEIQHSLPLNFDERRGIQGIISEIAIKYQPIKQIILYGSKARGNLLKTLILTFCLLLIQNF